MEKTKLKALSPEEGRKRLGEMIKGIQFAMLTTVDENGVLRSRPMATPDTGLSDGGTTDELWFCTSAGSPKVKEIQLDPRVNISYAEPDDNSYISVSGFAELVHDPKKARELWSPIVKAWLPKGPDDPDTTLLKVKIQHAEYWERQTATMVPLIAPGEGAPLTTQLTGEKQRETGTG